MMRVSVKVLFAVMTASAIGVYSLPGISIHLNHDAIAELSDGSQQDAAEWRAYLGRSDYTMAAWSAVENANSKWKSKQYHGAIDDWWSAAQKFRDTEAALAALDNIANAETALGNKEGSVHAWEMTLLLPEPIFVDGGLNLMNYRHDACVALSQYHETQQNLAMAERFLSQALSQDRVKGTCGVCTSSVILDLDNRLKALQARQGKQSESR